MIKEFERSYKKKICCHCKRKFKWSNDKNNCPACLIRKRKNYNSNKAKIRYTNKLKKIGKERVYKTSR